MEIEIDGVKYKMIPVPPHASPYNTFIGELLRKKPETVEAADATSREIKKAMEKLFAETVTPTPKPEHQTQLFYALSELTTNVMTEAGLFRKDSGSDAPQGDADRADTADKT